MSEEEQEGSRTHSYHWGGNQYGSHLVWPDHFLKDLEMSFRVKPDALGGWKTIITRGDFTAGRHGFETKQAAIDYCEEYLREEFKPEVVHYFG